MKRRVTNLFVVVLLAVASASSCSRNDSVDIPCSDEEYWDQVNAECVPRLRDGQSNNVDTPDAGDVQNNVVEEMGVEPDMGPSNIFNPSCDKDNDGALAIECGGDDCDDNDPLRAPGNPEFCDGIDNNCNGVINEGLICTFYAHSGTTLYAIDPFMMTIEEIGADLPNLQDIDTHPNGALLGVNFDGLFQFDDLRNSWFQVGEFGNDGPSDPNGMAIDQSGRIFVTSQDDLFEVDIVDGQASRIGELGGDYYSSGDCVVNKQDTLYMTSKHDESTDWLLLVNRANGSATEVGPIGFRRVFALTAAWGTLYGLTDDGGQLIEINTMTGEGTLIHEFQGTRFFGAASTPSR